MKEKLNVLSLFDGKSCGQISLKSLGFNIENYYASEIDHSAIKVAMINHPITKQVGDVRNLKGIDFQHCNLIIGGSPCQSFSFMGKRKGMVTKCEVVISTLKQYLKLKENGFEFIGQSYLYWEFVRLYTEISVLRGDKPTYFLLENVGMLKKWENLITNSLGVTPYYINSSLVTAQNRYRIYWSNIPGITIPEDMCITLDQIIPDAVTGRGIRRGEYPKGHPLYHYRTTDRKDQKSNTILTTFGGGTYGTCNVLLKDGTSRVLTINEAELLQGLTPGYTNVDGVTKTQKMKMIGNGWSIPVIKHLFKSITNINTIEV